MAKYIVLVNWTDQGIRNAKDTVKRAQAFREMAKSMKVKVDEFFWTLGPYDLVCSFDAPDDETVTRLGLMLGMQGNVRTITLRAFGETEMGHILQKLA